MRTVYATQFRILPYRDQQPSDLIQAVLGQCASWCTDRYAKEGIKVEIKFEGETTEPKPGHRIFATSDVIEDHAVLTLDWSYPHEPDKTLLWETQVKLAISQGDVEVSVLVRISAVHFAVQPIEYDLGRPRLTPCLLSNFSCVSGSTQLRSSVQELDSPDVAQFVEHVLRDQRRNIPVIVVSPDVWTDKQLIDAGRLQDVLAGLALVVGLKTKWAAFELTDVIGREYSCYNGAVRLYWPGFTGNDADGVDHHVYLPGAIRLMAERGRTLERQLFRNLAALGALRFTEGEVTRRAQSAIDHSRRAHFETLLAQAKTGNIAVDQELLDLALSENERLEKDTAAQKTRIAELENDLATYRANLASMQQFQRGATGEVGVSGDGDGSQVQSVLEALEQVAKRRKDVVVVYQSPYEGARRSDFARPDEILKGLIAIADLGEAYFNDKGSIGPWEKFFEKNGIKYSPNESQNTLNMYGDERRFSHDGRRVQMVRHVTIGRGDTKNCVQIYFEPNDQTSRMEIGYCGRHLPYYGKGT